MSRISKVVFNVDNWTRVTGTAQTGIQVIHEKRGNYNFGLEEWNNCQILKKHKLAYLDSFRSFNRSGCFENIELINFYNHTVYHIGTLKGVRVIASEEIEKIRNTLINENWLKIVEQDFQQIQDLRLIEKHTEYMRCWHSNEIVAGVNQGFVLNIRYDEMIYFDEPRNLTLQDERVNLRWRRLVHLYRVRNEFQNLFSL